MGEYYHSVTLEKSKCMGCTNCIKRCPTEAIRVRDGKARIIDERCIDCENAYVYALIMQRLLLLTLVYSGQLPL